MPIKFAVLNGRLQIVVATEARTTLEVKTGGSRLNAHEREVERAVRESGVSFEVLRLG